MSYGPKHPAGLEQLAPICFAIAPFGWKALVGDVILQHFPSYCQKL
jgi:hypothetical protein